MEQPSIAVDSGVAAHASGEVRRFLANALRFMSLGLCLYGALYVASERLIDRYAKRNRFYTVKTAPAARYDFIILGASHAAALGYDDLTSRLEAMTGSRGLNLAITGAGVTVNRVVLEYFLTRRTASTLLYVVDSFVFYSRQWNEERLQDVRLLHRAPFDPALARVLWRQPAARWTAIDYVVGFSKINNSDRWKPDMDDVEATGRFQRTYRPIPQIDEQRLEYLYPAGFDRTASLARYLSEFEDLIRAARLRNIRVVVIKPPIPSRIYDGIPDEARFDAALTAALRRQEVEFHDYSLVANDQQFFFDSDHLNPNGAVNFFDTYLKYVLNRRQPS